MNRLTLFVSLIFCYSSIANVKLPRVLGDHMVLQRDQEQWIWGWAEMNEGVSVFFDNQLVKTKADKFGNWQVKLPKHTAGGPYELIVKGKNEVRLNDILVGDVYIFSGQSNMGWTMSQSGSIYQEEIQTANNSSIRQFAVKAATSSIEQVDVESEGWQMVDSTTVKNFSAVGYFTAKSMYEKTKVPVGIINSSWGGSSIEFWMSKEAMANFPKVVSYYAKEDSILKGAHRVAYRKERIDQWTQNGMSLDLGMLEKWYENTVSLNEWKLFLAPSLIENQGLGLFDGIVWFKKQVDIPAAWQGKEVNLMLSSIDDWDFTYVNGELVGETKSYTKTRNYKIRSGLFKTGINTITIRDIDYGGGGGFNGKSMYLECDGQMISLNGEWNYRVGKDFSEMKEYMFAKYAWRTDWKPSSVYNAMIHPLTMLKPKGFIWYQGESNAEDLENAFNYRFLLKSLVADVRSKFKNDSMLFVCIQLPNFGQPEFYPVQSNWALMRESQASVSEITKAGLVVTIGLGEANDIHPKNKKDVGIRTAKVIFNLTEKSKNKYVNPLYYNGIVNGNEMVLEFKTAGTKLICSDRYGYVKGFAVAGEDKKFYWAKAFLTTDNKVQLSSNNVSNPKYVRYGWSDNPEDLNLSDENGMPVMPFRTDK